MIIPSIASANPLAYAQSVDSLGGYPALHIDIEDGNFIPNITFGMKTVAAIRNAYPRLSLNAHLMTARPEDCLEPLAALGVREIALHIESLPYPLAVMNRARDLGMLPGLAFNFATPISAAAPFIGDVDFLLVMTSEPDGRGAAFHPCAPARIAEAASILGPNRKVWVDGGVGESELPVVRDAGASVVIMGRAIFNSPDPAEKLAELNGILQKRNS